MDRRMEKYSANNNVKYWKALAECKVDYNDNRENVIKNSICEKLNGETEGATEYGIVDILTDNKII